VKKVDIEQTTLDRCVDEAQSERIIVTRQGRPVALIVSVEGLDEEQLQLGSGDKFWTLIEERRKEQTITRAELEEMLADVRVAKPIP
jgi:antitoxin (DNA-binding transcriptional repressor) of toxin-antitoxin stability system